MRILLTLTVLAVAACACPSVTEPADSEPTTRQIQVTSDAEIRIDVATDGSCLLQVIFPGGSPHAGTYISESKYLLDDFWDMQNMRGEPGVEAWIEVDETGEIQTVSNQVTMQ